MQNFRDGLTLQEVLDIVESNDIGDFEDIFIEPPEPNVLTDEDSGNEDDGGPTSDLSARQLTAGAEIRYAIKYITAIMLVFMTLIFNIQDSEEKKFLKI